jgi:hypothetical protein
MPACASCLDIADVRLHDVLIGGQSIRVWWCSECAITGRRQGLQVEPAPAWIERAALRQLPVKEIPDPVRAPVVISRAPWKGDDRRRGERRRTGGLSLQT